MIDKQNKTDTECALKSIHDAIAFSSKDFSLDKIDAWVYGIALGWDEALPSVAEKHRWDDATVNRLKCLRADYKRLENKDI